MAATEAGTGQAFTLGAEGMVDAAAVAAAGAGFEEARGRRSDTRTFHATEERRKQKMN